MSKLTEDETARLLRETFAEREKLVDELPAATAGPRGRGPVLLAAASVLVVLGGALFVADRTGSDEPGVAQASPAPVTSAPGPETTGSGQTLPLQDAVIWAATAEAAAKIEIPAGRWPVIYVLDAPAPGVATPTSPAGRGRPFDVHVRNLIAARLAPLGPVQWVRDQPRSGPECERGSRGPYITLSPVALVGEHAEVGIRAWRGCQAIHWKTYRLDKQGTGWRVTGTVGPEAVS
jgi:hypothetical protein